MCTVITRISRLATSQLCECKGGACKGSKAEQWGHETSDVSCESISEIDEDDLTSKKTFSRVSLSLCHDFYLKMPWFGLDLQKDEKFGRKFFRAKFFVTLVTQSLPYSFFSAILLHTTNSLSYYHLVDINFSHYNLTTKIWKWSSSFFLVNQYRVFATNCMQTNSKWYQVPNKCHVWNGDL